MRFRKILISQQVRLGTGNRPHIRTRQVRKPPLRYLTRQFSTIFFSSFNLSEAFFGQNFLSPKKAEISFAVRFKVTKYEYEKKFR